MLAQHRHACQPMASSIGPTLFRTIHYSDIHDTNSHLLYTIHSAIDQNHGLELTIFKIELKPQNDNYLQNDNLTPLKLNM